MLNNGKKTLDKMTRKRVGLGMKYKLLIGVTILLASAIWSGCQETESATMNKTFKWTVPFDNDKVASYEFRYARTVDSLNTRWANCVLIPTPAVPGFIGATDSAVTTLSLPLNVRYYFAIKAKDPAGNMSAISNIFDTTLTDVLPPSAITDLR